MDKLFVFVIAVCGVVFVAIIAALVVYAGDNIGAQPEQGAGVVVDKRHYNPYTSFIMVGKVMVPQFHPERWELCVQVAGASDCVGVSKEKYDSASDGTQVSATYILGNWTGSLYVRSVQF